MMRAARFVAQLGFTAAPSVVEAMTERAATINIVSPERVHDELVKLMVAPDPRAGLELLVDTGLAEQVLPELPALKLEIDEHHRHKDVYEHSLTVLDRAIALEGPRSVEALESPAVVDGPDLVLRLAALRTTSASRRRAGSSPAAGCPSIITRSSAPSSPASGCGNCVSTRTPSVMSPS